MVVGAGGTTPQILSCVTNTVFVELKKRLEQQAWPVVTLANVWLHREICKSLHEDIVRLKITAGHCSVATLG